MAVGGAFDLFEFHCSRHLLHSPRGERRLRSEYELPSCATTGRVRAGVLGGGGLE